MSSDVFQTHPHWTDELWDRATDDDESTRTPSSPTVGAPEPEAACDTPSPSAINLNDSDSPVSGDER